MKNTAFYDEQYVDAASLNRLSATVSGDFGLSNSSLAIPGLLFPEAATLAATGLSVGATLTAPFGVLFANGVISQAHGVLTNADTQSYVVNFAGLVPGSGSVTAFLVASYASILQQPFQVIGPQAGHPDYNPSFAPYTAYAQQVDSLALSATTTPPDGATTFELARGTLAAGATGIVLTTAYQARAMGLSASQVVSVGGAVAVTAAMAGKVLQASGVATPTLPSVSGVNGLGFGFSCLASGLQTVGVTGGDRIFGIVGSPNIGAASMVVSGGESVGVLATPFGWQVVTSSQFGITAETAAAISTSTSGALLRNLNLGDLTNIITAKTNLGLKYYRTSNYTPTAGTGFEESHLLGALPGYYSLQAWLVCRFAESGYSPGDNVQVNAGGTSRNDGGMPYVNNTKVGLSIGNNGYYVTPKGGGNVTSLITPGNWYVYIILEYN